MKIGILLASSDEYLPQAQYSAPNKLEYCLKWGHEFHFYKLSADSGKGLSNQRMFAISDAIVRYDWLWFLGADTLIMNMNIDIKTIIDDDYDFIIGKDINGLNNDSCLFKNNSNSINFLHNIIRYNEKYENDGFSMPEVIKDFPNYKVKIINQNLFNSYLYHIDPLYDFYLKHIPKEKHPRGFKPGDFVLHFPGMSNEHRLELFKEYAPQVIK